MGRRIPCRLLLITLFLVGVCPTTNAQLPNAQRTAYEFSIAWLGVTPRGDVTTNSNTVDFVSDLGMKSLQSQLRFQFVIRPSDRKRIQIEYLPYRFDGETTIDRSFRFGGVTYNIDDRITSKASLNHIAVSFQYDLVQQEKVDAGVIGGITYLGLDAKANSASAGESEVKRNIAFPLAGGALRISPASRLPWLTIRIDGKGMTFGSYGHYIEGSGALGLKLASHFTLEAGYRVVNGDGHQGTRGAKFGFNGPLVGFRIHDPF